MECYKHFTDFSSSINLFIFFLLHPSSFFIRVLLIVAWVFIFIYFSIFSNSVSTQLQKEQEEIVRKRPPEQKGLTLKEIREMEYLSKVQHPYDKIHFPLVCTKSFSSFSSYDFKTLAGDWRNTSCDNVFPNSFPRGKKRCQFSRSVYAVDFHSFS